MFSDKAVILHWSEFILQNLEIDKKNWYYVERPISTCLVWIMLETNDWLWKNIDRLPVHVYIDLHLQGYAVCTFVEKC